MRVLFVLGTHLPDPRANGVCVMHIQKALDQMGIPSDVVCEGKQEEIIDYLNGEVYVLPLVEKGSEIKLVDLILKLVRFIFWPIKHPLWIKAIKKKIRELEKVRQYDMVVGITYPIYTALACSKEKNFVLYELDPIANNLEMQHGIKKLLSYRALNIEKKLFNRAKSVFHMECDKAFYGKSTFDSYRHKFIQTDIPILSKIESLDCGKSVDNCSPEVRMIYTGSLMKAFRSPDYIIFLIRKYAENHEVKLSFYSRGDCEQMIEAASKEAPGTIKQYGYVSKAELEKAYDSADFAVSIGNASDGDATPTPSKIFEYMSYRKPIIHVLAGENDIVPQYLSRYPMALLLNPNDEQGFNLMKLQTFVKEYKGKSVSFDELAAAFPKNTPEYTAQLIKNLLK